LKAQVVENALAISKGSLRRENNIFGVYLLAGTHVTWRPVEVGLTSETRAEIHAGLNAGDAVAMPSDRPLKNGLEVTPIFP
jgi:hypothetical protein